MTPFQQILSCFCDARVKSPNDLHNLLREADLWMLAQRMGLLDCMSIRIMQRCQSSGDSSRITPQNYEAGGYNHTRPHVVRALWFTYAQMPDDAATHLQKAREADSMDRSTFGLTDDDFQAMELLIQEAA
ncbi:hypothetical protein H6758_00735 [Candidatus Nomurabacteria bacterium]|nr:hypothetical protein [Candidatus Nomurabacteria bacterium]